MSEGRAAELLVNALGDELGAAISGLGIAFACESAAQNDVSADEVCDMVRYAWAQREAHKKEFAAANTAAACGPELLTALENLLKAFLEEAADTDGVREEHVPAVEAAEAVIKKARPS